MVTRQAGSYGRHGAETAGHSCCLSRLHGHSRIVGHQHPLPTPAPGLASCQTTRLNPQQNCESLPQSRRVHAELAAPLMHGYASTQLLALHLQTSAAHKPRKRRISDQSPTLQRRLPLHPSHACSFVGPAPVAIFCRASLKLWWLEQGPTSWPTQRGLTPETDLTSSGSTAWHTDGHTAHTHPGEPGGTCCGLTECGGTLSQRAATYRAIQCSVRIKRWSRSFQNRPTQKGKRLGRRRALQLFGAAAGRAERQLEVGPALGAVTSRASGA